MKAAVYYTNSDVRIEERPRPQIRSGEILVRIKASGICGSDVMEWYRKKKAPIVLGHEITGVVEETGQGVDRYKVGDRVAVSHHVPCNTCRHCMRGDHTACHTLHTTNFDPGGFCEFVRVPVINVDRGTFLLPDSMTFLEGAFAEPLACVVRGQRVSGLRPGDTVLVLGSGISGALHIMLAAASGAGRIIATDVSHYRLQRAKDFGADAVVSAREDVPARVRELNEGRLADQVIVCAGALSAFNQALKSVEPGGTVLCFAPTDPGVELSIPANDFWRNSIRVLPSYANSPYDATVALEYIKTGKVPVAMMVTHRLPLDRTAEGFQLVAKASESLKVIIEPHGDATVL